MSKYFKNNYGVKMDLQELEKQISFLEENQSMAQAVLVLDNFSQLKQDIRNLKEQIDNLLK